jgi:GNAT superfamily N-acetyltransferase
MEPRNRVLQTAEVRRLIDSDSIPELTRLLHRSYGPLAAMGMRFLASHQSDAVTRKRVGGGECFIALIDGAIVGTIIFMPAANTDGTPWLDRPEVASLGQFAVEPELQRGGLGQRLMERVERCAVESGAAEIALDTAETATHLIEWYGKCGYRLIEYAQWHHTNYRSAVLSKSLR